METEYFFLFLLMLVYLFIPFGAIYFTLYTLNWNERKSLFFESWLVFVTWVISNIAAFFLAVLLTDKFYNHSGSNIYKFFIPITILTGIISIAGVLFLKVREREKNLSFIENNENERIGKTSRKKIWQTSVIISVLTLAVAASLAMFIGDISDRIDKLYPKSDNHFGIYD